MKRGAAGLVVGCAAALLLTFAAPAGADPGDPQPDSTPFNLIDQISNLLSTLSAPPRIPPVVGPTLPLNDLEAMLALGGAQLADMLPPTVIPHPTLKPVPRAQCDGDSRPLDGMQGRVPLSAINSPAAKQGWTCNVTEVSHHRTPGGFRVWRYADTSGHTCAFYDTSLMSPLNLISVAGGPSLGVAVLDMTDPTRPVRTSTLTTLAMLSPHESLNLNPRRGLLAAEVGNALTLPGSLAVYDVQQDCRHPRLLSQKPTLFGHESGFTDDGLTYWVAGGAGFIEAIDLRDPRHPTTVWKGAYYAHGLNLSPDGNTLYQTDPINGNVGILDVSEVQSRRPDPHVRDISRMTWDSVSIPQNTVPFTRDGHHYLLEFDEFAFRFNPVTIDDQVGAARIIDIDDPVHPRTVSDLRLEVNMRDAHHEASVDPSPVGATGVLGYATHYCSIPNPVDPTIAACSAINSGLRVFDIRDPQHPREVAYFIAPPKAGTLLGLLPGNVAFSQPAFDPARRQVWYTDAGSGFYALQLSKRAWPQ